MPLNRDPEGKQIAALHQIASFTGKRVLEIGCGDGRITWGYADNTAHVTGIDPVAENIAKAQKNMPKHLSGRVKFVEAGIEDFAFPRENPKFDFAVFGWSL